MIASSTLYHIRSQAKLFNTRHWLRCLLVYDVRQAFLEQQFPQKAGCKQLLPLAGVEMPRDQASMSQFRVGQPRLKGRRKNIRIQGRRGSRRRLILTNGVAKQRYHH